MSEVDKKLDEILEFIETQREMNASIVHLSKLLSEKKSGYSENKRGEVKLVSELENTPLLINENVEILPIKGNVVPRLQAYMNEFIGVFFIALSVILSTLSGNPVIATFSSTGVIISLIYAGGHISRAHYNPAMTLIFLLRQEVSLFDGFMYTLIQFVAATVGVVVGSALLPFGAKTFVYSVAPGTSLFQALVLEMLYTFLLGWIVINVATAKVNHGNEFYGVAVGFGIMAIVFTIGGFTGSCVNPSLGFGTIIVHAIRERSWLRFGDLWIYLIGPYLGGFIATMMFYAAHTDELKIALFGLNRVNLRKLLL